MSGRRSKRILIGAAVMILLGQLGMGVLLDRNRERTRFPDVGVVLDRARAAPPEAVLFGSSRFKESLKTDLIVSRLADALPDPPVVLNAAIPGSDPIVFAFLLERLLENGARPKLAVVELSPETLAVQNRWLRGHITRQLDWSDLFEMWPDIRRTGRYSRIIKTRLQPIHHFRYEILRWLLGSAPPYFHVPPVQPAAVESAVVAQAVVDPAAVAPAPTDERRVRTEAGLVPVRKWLRGYEVGGASIHALDRLLERCQAEGIEVVLVDVPVIEEQRALYTPAIDGPYRARVAERLGPRVHFVDHRSRIPDAGFSDNHHANPEGARLYSAAIADTLVERLRGRVE